MDYYPREIIDHILYFTVNKVFDLSLVNKYFNDNVKKVRITNNRNYPRIKDENLKKLPNLTVLNLYRNKLITNEGLSSLTKLTSLNLGYNTIITNEAISNLT